MGAFRDFPVAHVPDGPDARGRFLVAVALCVCLLVDGMGTAMDKQGLPFDVTDFDCFDFVEFLHSV